MDSQIKNNFELTEKKIKKKKKKATGHKLVHKEIANATPPPSIYHDSKDPTTTNHVIVTEQRKPHFHLPLPPSNLSLETPTSLSLPLTLSSCRYHLPLTNLFFYSHRSICQNNILFS